MPCAAARDGMVWSCQLLPTVKCRRSAANFISYRLT
ncbi:hypothetical protein X942_4314 [Burkholderia pseudomallei MSHR5596]|nr:hypothetical protein X942_4314 [Burkholderia pseudomallei MSHR5596]KGW92981.1 hypothetical protein Y048_4404 [Burkholderia pseudomallei MSHR456]